MASTQFVNGCITSLTLRASKDRLKPGLHLRGLGSGPEFDVPAQDSIHQLEIVEEHDQRIVDDHVSRAAQVAVLQEHDRRPDRERPIRGLRCVCTVCTVCGASLRPTGSKMIARQSETSSVGTYHRRWVRVKQYRVGRLVRRSEADESGYYERPTLAVLAMKTERQQTLTPALSLEYQGEGAIQGAKRRRLPHDGA